MKPPRVSSRRVRAALAQDPPAGGERLSARAEDPALLPSAPPRSPAGLEYAGEGNAVVTRPPAVARRAPRRGGPRRCGPASAPSRSAGGLSLEPPTAAVRWTRRSEPARPGWPRLAIDLMRRLEPEVMTKWEDVNTRARGLGCPIAPPEEMPASRRPRDLQRWARVGDAGVLPVRRRPGGDATAARDLLCGAAAARVQVRMLRAVAGTRDDALAVALDVEDRRSLRALIRGASKGAPAEARLAGLIPTAEAARAPAQELAGQGSVRGARDPAARCGTSVRAGDACRGVGPRA